MLANRLRKFFKASDLQQIDEMGKECLESRAIGVVIGHLGRTKRNGGSFLWWPGADGYNPYSWVFYGSLGAPGGFLEVKIAFLSA